MIIMSPGSSLHPPMGQHCCLLGQSSPQGYPSPGRELNEKKLKQVGEVKSLVMTEDRKRCGGGERDAEGQTERTGNKRLQNSFKIYETRRGEEKEHSSVLYKWETLRFFRNTQTKIYFFVTSG